MRSKKGGGGGMRSQRGGDKNGSFLYLFRKFIFVLFEDFFSVELS